MLQKGEQKQARCGGTCPEAQEIEAKTPPQIMEWHQGNGCNCQDKMSASDRSQGSVCPFLLFALSHISHALLLLSFSHPSHSCLNC